MVRGRSASLILACFLFACDEPGGRVGPCVHVYKEPILHIMSARDRDSGEFLQTITLKEMRIDSTKIDPFWLTLEGRNVVALDSTLVCTLPCAFGVSSGTYVFTVSGEGVRDTVISCNPAYTVNEGGCPSSSDGGLRISLELSSR